MALILEIYWNVNSPTAKFEIPAQQSYENVTPVAPGDLDNWQDVLKTIKLNDSTWTSVQERPIEVRSGAAVHVYQTTDPDRKAVEDFIVQNKRLLENTL